MPPRVKRSKGPSGTLTEATYRRKAFKHLVADFENRCAYCMQLLDRPDLEKEIDHFNAHLKSKPRNQYWNLMLACRTCNNTKRAKLVCDPADTRRRLLNCTLENEFPEHIVEADDGRWIANTPAGDYHLTALDLNMEFFRRKRAERAALHREWDEFRQSAVRYTGNLDAGSAAMLLTTLERFRDEGQRSIPLVTEVGTKQVCR